jgi:glycerol-3-phosphate O-acyltransferase
MVNKSKKLEAITKLAKETNITEEEAEKELNKMLEEAKRSRNER